MNKKPMTTKSAQVFRVQRSTTVMLLSDPLSRVVVAMISRTPGCLIDGPFRHLSMLSKRYNSGVKSETTTETKSLDPL